MCLVASARGESLVVPLWVHEAIVMHPAESPKAEIWVTIAIHVEHDDTCPARLTLVHPGGISPPRNESESLLENVDEWESLLKKKKAWLNYCINHTDGRSILCSEDGQSLSLEHDIKGPLPFTMWEELEYALKPVYPVKIGSSDGAEVEVWPGQDVSKKVHDKGCEIPFTEISVTVPRDKDKKLRICRFQFETKHGIKKAGILGQYLFPAYGPNEMVSEIREALLSLPQDLQAPFLERYRKATEGFREIQYDVTMLGCPRGHTYIVDWGDEHRATPMFAVPDPEVLEASRQVFSFTPKHLNFRLQLLAVPACVSK